MNKTGVFGGTFNPVHKGHESAAIQFYDTFKLDELLIIPSNIPPHKTENFSVTPKERLLMCNLAFSDIKNKNITVSDIEIKDNGVSYTFNTLTALHDKYKQDECSKNKNVKFYFLIGSDMLFYLDKWYRYKDLFDLCTFVVAERCKEDLRSEKIESVINFYKKRYNAVIEFLKINFFEISSTQIRDKIKKNEDVSEYLSSKVADYIKCNNMYKY